MTSNWLISPTATISHWITLFMANGFKYFAVFVSAFLCACLLTPFFRSLAWKIGMVDKPDPRRINKVPIPRGAGISIILSFQIVAWLFCLITGESLFPGFPLSKQFAFLNASLFLAVVGFVDDWRGMRAIVKLCGQILAAFYLWFEGFRIGGVLFSFPAALDCPLTIFWIVGAVNAFNLIDGLDGLASGLAFIASAGMAGVLFSGGHSSMMLPYLIFAGACLGFLRYNFHPASVFLGDTGSMFLGLFLASFPLVTGSRKELLVSVGMPLLVMGIPIFDTFLAIWRRTVRRFLPNSIVESISSGEGVMRPDKEHLHHRLLRELKDNQRRVAWVLYAAAAGIVLLGISGILLKGRGTGLFFIAFTAATMVVIRNFECVELLDTGKLFTEHLSEKFGRFRYIPVPLSIAVDVFVMGCIWLVCWFTTMSPGELTFDVARNDIFLFVVPAFTALCLAKTYRRVWRRAQLRDHIALATSLFLASCASIGLVWIFQEWRHHLIRFALLFASLSSLCLCAIRARRECIEALMFMLGRRVAELSTDSSRILVYGGGLRLRGYLRERSKAARYEKEPIVGIIDDEPMLAGRMLAGYPVLGTFEELPEIVKTRNISRVVVTCLMTEEKLAAVKAKLRELGIPASLWRCEEIELV